MARNDVAGIVSGAGLLTSIFTFLTEEVKKRGGIDDDIHRLTRPDGRATIEAMADLIVGTYEEEVNYDDPKWKTIDRSRYAYIGEVTADDYPETQTGIKKVRFREVWFDHDPLDEEILRLAEQINCRQPSRAESETVIRQRHTREQLAENPRIGLVGPVVGRLGRLRRAYVFGYGFGVDLGWSWTGSRWNRHCRFVLVCK